MFHIISQCTTIRPLESTHKCIFLGILLLPLLTEAILQEGATNPLKYCGMALNDILDMICLNGYLSRLRRSLPALEKLENYNVEQILQTTQYRPIQKRHRRQDLNGIISECCRKGCIYADIAKYCRRTSK